MENKVRDLCPSFRSFLGQRVSHVPIHPILLKFFPFPSNRRTPPRLLLKLPTFHIPWRLQLDRCTDCHYPFLPLRIRQVSALPTVLVYKDGKHTTQFTGAMPEAQLKQFLDSL